MAAQQAKGGRPRGVTKRGKPQHAKPEKGRFSFLQSGEQQPGRQGGKLRNREMEDFNLAIENTMLLNGGKKGPTFMIFQRIQRITCVATFYK